MQASSIVPALDGILQQIQLDLNPMAKEKDKVVRRDSLVASLILLVDRGCSESSELEKVRVHCIYESLVVVAVEVATRMM